MRINLPLSVWVGDLSFTIGYLQGRFCCICLRSKVLTWSNFHSGITNKITQDSFVRGETVGGVDIGWFVYYLLMVGGIAM